jgi:Zn-dependent protease
MISFTVKGLKIGMSFSFFAVIALLVSFEGTSYVLLGLIACILHELGHISAMCLYGVSPKEIVFYGAGIKIVPNYNKLLPLRKEIIILLAGSISNFQIFGALYFFSRGDFHAQLFAAINLIIGIFNLIPFKYFDGGRVLELVLSESSAKNPYFIRRTISMVMIMLLLALVVIMAVNGTVNPSFYFSIGYIVFSELML